MQGDSWYEIELHEADPARYAAESRLRASDDMCMTCRIEDCPAAFGGGVCPLDEAEADYRDLCDIQHAAMNGTL